MYTGLKKTNDSSSILRIVCVKDNVLQVNVAMYIVIKELILSKFNNKNIART